MAFLTPTPSNENVPQLETTDVAQGGASGVMNSQAQALLNKVTYGENKIEQLASSLYVTDLGSNGNMTLSLNGKAQAFFDNTNAIFKDGRTQVPNWGITLTGAFDTAMSSAGVDAQGNSLVIGGMTDVNQSGMEMIAAKLDFYGNILWKKSYSGPVDLVNVQRAFGEDAMVDSNGDLIAIVSIEPGWLTLRHIIMKISGVDGSIVWQYYLDNNFTTGFITSISAITLDSADNIYVAGETDIGGVSNLIKLDTNGVIVWNRGIRFSTDAVLRVNDLRIDTNGEIYFSAKNANNVGGCILKFSSIGIFIWNTSMYSNLTAMTNLGEDFYGLQVGATGVYVSTQINGGDLGNAQVVYKLDKTTGSILWSNHVSTYTNRGLAYTISLDPITEDLLLPVSSAQTPLTPDESLAFIKIDKNGNELWTYNVRIPGRRMASWYNYGFKDSCTRNGFITVCGFSWTPTGATGAAHVLHLDTSVPLAFGTYGDFVVEEYPNIGWLPTTPILENAPLVPAIAFTSISVPGDVFAPVVFTSTDSLSRVLDKINLSTDTIQASNITTPAISCSVNNTSYGLGTPDTILLDAAVITGNTAIGNKVLPLVTGSNNTAIGDMSATGTTTGWSNISVGQLSFKTNQYGNRNIAIGNNAIGGSYGASMCTVIGTEALVQIFDFIGNTVVGFSAAANCTGSYNTVLGTFSGMGITTGANNVCVGYNTYCTPTGNNNVYLGSNIVTVGDWTNNIVIGAGATPKGSFTTSIGATGNTDTYLQGNLHYSGVPVSTSKSVVATAALVAVTITTANTYLTGTAGASLAITLPAASAALDGYKYVISSTVARAAVTWISTGAIVNGLTALAANVPVALQYDHATLNWYATL